MSLNQWNLKLASCNNEYDKARVIEQWAKDFNERTWLAWNKIDKGLTEEYLLNESNRMEKFNELLTEEEKSEQEEIKDHAQRFSLKDENIKHNICAGIVRDKK